MKILVLTQKVDKNDVLLSFMHDWLLSLAGIFEFVAVICLEKGEFSLPGNVRVFSLGKEEDRKVQQFPPDSKSVEYKVGNSRFRRRIKYARRFLRYIVEFRKDYDAVFVHMNKEYAALGGLPWRILGKPVFFWYNHIYGDWLVRLAVFFSRKVFYTSPFAFTSRFKKAVAMPAGIDTDFFSPFFPDKKRRSILFLGRISPVKNLATLLEAAGRLKRNGADFRLSIYGGRDDEDYARKMEDLAKKLGVSDKIDFLGMLSHKETPRIYRRHDLFVNLTNKGSLDKTTLEAMACGSLVLVSNEAYRGLFPADLSNILIFEEGNSSDLAAKIEKIFSLSEERKKEIGEKMRELVLEKHSLRHLVQELAVKISA